MAKKTQNKDSGKLDYISKKNIRIYPISESEYFSRIGNKTNHPNSKNWYVEVNNNGKIKTFSKSVISTELEDAIWKTIVYYYNLLTDKK